MTLTFKYLSGCICLVWVLRLTLFFKVGECGNARLWEFCLHILMFKNRLMSEMFGKWNGMHLEIRQSLWWTISKKQLEVKASLLQVETFEGLHNLSSKGSDCQSMNSLTQDFDYIWVSPYRRLPSPSWMAGTTWLLEPWQKPWEGKNQGVLVNLMWIYKPVISPWYGFSSCLPGWHILASFCIGLTTDSALSRPKTPDMCQKKMRQGQLVIGPVFSP